MRKFKKLQNSTEPPLNKVFQRTEDTISYRNKARHAVRLNLDYNTGRVVLRSNCATITANKPPPFSFVLSKGYAKIRIQMVQLGHNIRPWYLLISSLFWPSLGICAIWFWPCRSGKLNNERFVIQNVAVGFPQGFLCTLLSGESYEGLPFHPPLLH